jgi:hypothetical protein
MSSVSVAEHAASSEHIYLDSGWIDERYK